MVQIKKTLQYMHQIGRECFERRFSSLFKENNPLINNGIISGGYSNLAGFYEVNYFAPINYYAIYTLKGEGELNIRGEKIILNPGTLFIGKPKLPHLRRTRRSKKWDVVWLMGSKNSIFSHYPSPKDVFPIKNFDNLRLLKHNVQGYQISDESGDSMAKYYYAKLIFHSLEKDLNFQTSRIGQYGYKLSEMFLLIEQEPYKDWSVANLSDALGISPQHLYTLCRKHFNSSPQLMIFNLRMKKAQELLSKTTKTIHEIARDIGYMNSFAFSVAFKRYSGKSPNQFRARLKEIF